MTGLYFLLFIGNDSGAVALASRPRGSNDHAHGNGLKINNPSSFPEVLPRVSLIPRRKRNRLAAVDHRTSAHCKDEIDLFFLCQRRAFLYLCISRVGHDSGKICHPFPRVLEDLFHFIIDPVLLDRTAAICQHDILPVIRNRLCQMFLRCAFTEIYLCRIFIHELLHD